MTELHKDFRNAARSAGPRQIVLAAGRSRRMGSPKPLLDFGGKTALELIVEAGQSAGCSGSIVVVGYRADDVRKAHPASIGVEWVLNDDPGSQQLRSLQLGLQALPPDTDFLVHPVDCPLVRADDYRRLIDAWRSGDRSATVYFITRGSSHGHPVLCAASVAAKLLALGPDQTARGVIRAEPSVDVHTENEAVLWNMNTPEDYRRMLEVYRTRQTRNPKPEIRNKSE